MAWALREGGARTLPASKKRREVVLAAVEDPVLLLALVLGEASGANVPQQGLVLRVSVRVGRLLSTSVLVVKANAHAIRLHERLRNTVYVRFSLPGL